VLRNEMTRSANAGSQRSNSITLSARQPTKFELNFKTKTNAAWAAGSLLRVVAALSKAGSK
jgi:hypothetical protein